MVLELDMGQGGMRGMVVGYDQCVDIVFKN